MLPNKRQQSGNGSRVASLGAWILILALALLPLQVAKADADRKIAWHVGFDDPAQFSAMLGSVSSLVEAYEGELLDYDIRLVFRAQGIQFVTDDNLEGTPFEVDPEGEFAEQRDELRTRLLQFANMHDVKLELCESTRAAVGLPIDDFYDPVEPVPSGIVRLGDLHHEGYALMHAYRN